MRTLIAVTTTEYTAAEYRAPQIMLGSPYVTAVERMGGTAVLLTPAHGPEALAHLVGACHGLLLSGGEDIDPSHYGQMPHPQLGSVSRGRDRMELEVLRLSLERDLPVLAICRGMQLLNVAFGGTLFQDLPSQRAQGIIHEQEAPVNHRWHAVAVEAGSRLESVVGTRELFINSFHHQGIDRLGEGLRPLAWAEDGLVEAVEAVDHSWVLGVQWHPERGEAEVAGELYEPDRLLFESFAAATREYAARLEEKAVRRGSRSAGSRPARS